MTHEGHLVYHVGDRKGPVFVPGSPCPPVLSTTRRRTRMVLAMLCIAYVAVLGLIWVAQLAAPIEFWPIHLFVYGPRWVTALPLLVLVPLAVWLRPRLLAVLALGAAITAGPILGFQVPWRTWLGGPARGRSLRVLTCNVGGGTLDRVALGNLINEARPDIVAFQEWGNAEPATVLWEGRWHAKVEQGVCLASRYPIRRVERLDRSPTQLRGLALLCELELPEGPIQATVVHLITPRDGLEMLMTGSLRGIGLFREVLREQWHESDAISRRILEAGGPTLVLGDFNLPEGSPVYRRAWSRFTDAFSSGGWGFGWSKYTRLIRARIDHILAGTGWDVVRSWVGPGLGGDHRPVLSDLVLTAPNPAP